jgi:uncharacterized sporulation protein YeaH/YhbH (DUF444 family)
VHLTALNLLDSDERQTETAHNNQPVKIEKNQLSRNIPKIPFKHADSRNKACKKIKKKKIPNARMIF